MKKAILLLVLLYVVSSVGFSLPSVQTNLQVQRGFGIVPVVLSPNSATTINVCPTISYLILDNAATVPTLGVILCSSNLGINLFDGQTYRIGSSRAITNLTIVSSSNVKGTSPTSLTAGNSIQYIWRKLTDTFYRIL